MRDIEDLFSKVRPYAPGASEPMMAEHIRKAAIKFCERTRCWSFEDSFPITGTEDEILCVPPFAVLFELKEARFNNMELERKAPNGDMLMHDEGMPRYITQHRSGTVSIEPRLAGILYISMFLKPAPDADMLPDILFDEFSDAIGDGALASLLLLPNQPYFQPQLAAVFQNQFNNQLDRNFAYNMRGQQRAAKRTRSSFL